MEGKMKKELGAGKVAFLARLDEITKEVKTGRTVMSIYREFGPKVEISYAQFDRYVNTLIKGVTPKKKTALTPPVKVKELSTLETLRTPTDTKDIF